MNKRLIIVIGTVVSVLLVLVVILLALVLNAQTKAAEQDAHERIVEICEESVVDPYGNGLQAMTECMDRLASN